MADLVNFKFVDDNGSYGITWFDNTTGETVEYWLMSAESVKDEALDYLEKVDNDYEWIYKSPSITHENVFEWIDDFVCGEDINYDLDQLMWDKSYDDSYYTAFEQYREACQEITQKAYDEFMSTYNG